MQADLTLAQYLQDYENLWAEMLGRGKSLGSYPVHAAMTWELSFRRIESLNPAAAQFLTLCGFFSPDEIPLSMIENGSGELRHEVAYVLLNPETRTEALNLLEQFALIKIGDGIISIHGVIAAMAQDRLDAEERAKWSTIALRIAAASFSFDSQNPSSWKFCAETLPHALSSTMHAQSAGVTPREVVDMLSRIGRFLLKQGNYSEARTLLEMAHALVKPTHGPASVQAADIANNLARVRHRLGDLAGASALYDIALGIDSANYGVDDPHVATVANNSAMTLVELGRLAEARQRFEWAVEVLSQVSRESSQNRQRHEQPRLRADAVERLQRRPAMARAIADDHRIHLRHARSPRRVACIAVNLGAPSAAWAGYPQARKLFDRLPANRPKRLRLKPSRRRPRSAEPRGNSCPIRTISPKPSHI